MQKPRGLDGILGKIGSNVKDNFEKVKNKIEEFPKYLDDRLRKIGDKISEYKPIIIGSAIAASPLYVKAPILTGLQIKNLYKGTRGKLLGYGLIVGGIAAVGLGIMFGLNAIHSLPSNHVQYVGSNGYEAFVPNGQTINYDGHTDPEGNLILNNGTTIHNVIWDGQYSNTIIQTDNQIDQLNNQFVGQTDPLNNQQYVNLQDFYVIEGPASVKQVIMDGQTYYVIDANKINPGDIAGFYTYDNWVSNFVTAMNTPGTYAAGLPGNSPVFQWTNTTGTLPQEIILYGQHSQNLIGGGLLVLPNETIIPYGIIYSPSGSAFSSFIAPSRVYNISS